MPTRDAFVLDALSSFSRLGVLSHKALKRVSSEVAHLRALNPNLPGEFCFGLYGVHSCWLGGGGRGWPRLTRSKTVPAVSRQHPEAPCKHIAYIRKSLIYDTAILFEPMSIPYRYTEPLGNMQALC